MARVKISRELAMKAFVMSLKETFGKGGNNTFIREQVDIIAKKTGQLGFVTFATAYGKMTRVRQGVYTIPPSWMTGNAPWEGVTEIVPVAKETKPKAPKEKKSKKEDETVVEAAPPVEPEVSKPAKTKLTKQELLEKAKQEIAKKKVVSVSE
jgi:hypothetical protein